MAFYTKFKRGLPRHAGAFAQKPVQWEDLECFALADYLRLRGFWFCHIANESGMRLPIGVITKRKRMGYGKGFPDYAVIVPGKEIGKNTLLFIEMKATKDHRTSVSPEQKEWGQALNGCKGIKSVVCYGFDEAQKEIEKLFNK
jgi:hypothetical protein